MKLAISKDKNQTKILFIILVLFVIAIYFYVLFLPSLKTIKALSPQIKTVKQQLGLIQTDENNTLNFKSQIESQSTKLKVYQKKLPTEEEIPTLLEELSRLAKDTNIQIIAIKPKRSQKTTENVSEIYVELPIDIIAKSGYHQLGHFINKLENADRFLKIKNIKIVASSDDPLRHDVSLVVSAFVLSGEKK